MKKIIFTFIILLIVPFISLAETIDTKGPILNSYTLNTTKVKSGDKINYTIDVTDDVSGAEQINFSYVDTTKDYNNDINAVLFTYCNIKNGVNNCDFQIPKGQTAGTYTLKFINVVDANNNLVRYCTELGQNDKDIVCDKTIANSILTIEDNLKNYPELVNFNYKLNNSGTVDFTVEVKDGDAVDILQVVYYNLDVVNLRRVEQTNLFKGTGKVDVPGKKYFNAIMIINKDGLQSNYMYSNENGGTANAKLYYIFEPGIYDFEYGDKDITRPTLNNIKLEKTTYKAPAIIKLVIDANDDIPNNLNNVQIDLAKLDDDGNILDNNINLYFTCNAVDYNSICTANVNQYTAAATYIIKNIIVNDKSYNTTIYTIDDKYINNPEETSNIGSKTKYVKLEPYTFIIEQDYNSDTTTSTINDNIVETIKNAKDNAIISIDSSNESIVKKEIFDAIKGTNKIIRIETEGIVWEFNGKNIKNPKDINTKVNIYKLSDYIGIDNSSYTELFDKALIIEFADNGILPGLVKIRIKADYTFRKYIGTENLKLYFDTNSKLFDIIASGIKLKDDGYYEFYLLHNSTYILTNQTIPEETINKNEEKTLGNDKLNETTSVEEDKEEIIIIENTNDEENTNNEVNNTEIKNKRNNNFIYIIIIVLIIFLMVCGVILFYFKIFKKHIKK